MMVIALHLGKAVMLRIAKRLNAADLLRGEISHPSPVEVKACHRLRLCAVGAGLACLVTDFQLGTDRLRQSVARVSATIRICRRHALMIMRKHPAESGVFLCCVTAY